MGEHDGRERDTDNDGSVSGRPVSWDRYRVASLVVALSYLVVAVWVFPSKSLTDLMATILLTAAGLSFPLACIWFGDEMGEYTGSLFRPITKSSPGIVVRIGGWILLLMPALTGLIIWWIDSGLAR